MCSLWEGMYVLKGGGCASELGPNSLRLCLAERFISDVNMVN